MRRDQLLPGLAAGKGDIAAANITIASERQKLVDFTVAGLSNVFVRKSSSYYESRSSCRSSRSRS